MASAENANNLGAPASGFGQDVTFAIRPGDVPSQRDLAHAVPVQAGVEGGDSQSRLQDHTITQKPPEDHSIEMLMRAGKEILEPKLKEARAAAFVSGMQRAAGGEAVKDIVENQPWYSRIFGDSDAVAGARAYTGHAQASAAAGALEDQMPTLRSMSPKDAQKVFTKTITGALTGDATTDVQIMSSLNSQMPALMRRQAKEHYAWQQGEASKAEAKSMLVGAAALQQSAQGTIYADDEGNIYPGATKPEEFATTAQAWVRSIAPPAGRDAANWQINTTKTLGLMAEQGLFHALSAFEKGGGFEALTSEQATSIKGKWESEEKSKRATEEGAYMKQIADIRAGLRVAGTEGQTINDYIKKMQDVNSAYTARTGSRLGIFTPEQMTDLVTQGVEGLRRDRVAEYKATKAAEAKATDVAAKDAKRVLGVKQIAAEFEKGFDHPEFDANDRREAWVELNRLGPDRYFPAAVKTFYTSTVVDGQRANQMQGAAQNSIAAVNPTAVLTMYRDHWLPMNSGYTKDANGRFTGDSGSGVAAAYMGTDLGKKMRIFHDVMKQGDEYALTAFNTAFVMPTKVIPLNGDKDDKTLRTDVASLTSHFATTWWGTTEEHGNIDLRDDQVEFVAGMVKKTKHDLMINSQDHKHGAKLALDNTKLQGLKTLGGFAWIDPQGARPFSLTIDRFVPINRSAESFKATVEAKIKAAGLTDDQVMIQRDNDKPQPTVNRENKSENPTDARFVIHVMSGGENHILTMTGGEVVATYRKKKLAQDAQTVFEQTTKGEPLKPTSTTSDRIRYQPNLVGADPRANAPTE